MESEARERLVHFVRLHMAAKSGSERMTIQNEDFLSRPRLPGQQLEGPFWTPTLRAGQVGSALYRAKWEIGYRLIGPASWTRRLRSKVSYESWVLSHVGGGRSFLLWRLGLRRPFTARVSGRSYTVAGPAGWKALSDDVWKSYRPSPFTEEVSGRRSGTFRFGFGGRDLSFPYEGDRFGPMTVLQEFFVREPYAGLDVNGIDVVDVGASIGDTPIYFCLKGARRVIAFEPYPATFAQAKRNVSENGFDDRVTLLNEGAGASGWMHLTEERRNLWANAVPSGEGVDVRFNSLNDIVDRFGIVKAALKLHGEGCEYEFLEGASREDLAHFPQIVLKYHYGAKRIVKKLKSSGFAILRKWDLHFSYNSHSSHPRYEAGMILAKMKPGS